MCILIHTYVYFIVLSLSLCFPGPKHHTFKSFSCPSVSISCFISLYLSWGVSDLQILNVCNRCIKEFCVRTCLGKFLTKGNYHWMSIRGPSPHRHLWTPCFHPSLSQATLQSLPQHLSMREETIITSPHKGLLIYLPPRTGTQVRSDAKIVWSLCVPVLNIGPRL